MDGDGNGSISVQELMVPLVGLGFVDSGEEVEDLWAKYDDDRSGEIEFEEFLKIILDLKQAHSKNSNISSAIGDFLNDFTRGNIKTGGLNFQNWVLT